MAAAVTWLLVILITSISCQRIELRYSNSTGLICKGAIYRSVKDLRALKGCVVILGNLQIFIQSDADFHDMWFDVREVTEYLVIYRVKSLESVGQLFPYLTRIRGLRLLNNFALIVFENDHLREIGLYNLLKIDRGGVILWLNTQACFVNTIDWRTLVQSARRVIAPSDKNVQCNIPCTCSLNASTNHCWNNMKCQLFLDGPEAVKCNKQCLGCRNTKPDACSVCRHYTHNGNCVSKCPPDTILIPDNQYCISEEECTELDRIVWNNTCIDECPIGYIQKKYKGSIICKLCKNCHKTCPSLIIQSIGSTEAAEKCVYINGSLTIHLKTVHGGMTALRKYLGQIKEVSGYILIESSDILTSLDFLKSLRRIRGNKLKDNKYIIDINNNMNLRSLFSSNVLKRLQVDRGTLRFEMNPKLCMNKIDEVRNVLSNKSLSIEVHEGTNGYSGDCEEVTFNIELQENSHTSMEVKFSPVNHDAYYAVLYARLTLGAETTVLPESCSVYEWHAEDVSLKLGQNYGAVNLTSLHLASTYVFCIELYDPTKKRLSRSNLFNFTTPVGVPEPSFILELVASSSDLVVIHWVDHKDYLSLITRYELDVTLIDIRSRGYPPVDYCNYKEDTYTYDTDYSRHALVRRPPPEYGRGCESMCGVLSTVTPGAMAEDNFDVCDGIEMKCDNNESIVSQNTSVGIFVRTLVLNISKGLKNEFQVGGLAPFSDYKFRLRACANKTCSRSSRGIVRTFHLENGDIPIIVYAYADQYGNVYVKWEPPKVSNGPIFTYTVLVLPRINIDNLLPQSWCMPSNVTSIVAKSVVASKYLVRICTKTLVPNKSCSDWVKIIAFYKLNGASWIVGITFGFLICIASLAIGWYSSRKSSRTDVFPLIVSAYSTRVESEPPSEMFSDFAPLYKIHDSINSDQ